MNIWEGLELSTPPRLLLGIILDHLNFEPQLRLTFSQGRRMLLGCVLWFSFPEQKPQEKNSCIARSFVTILPSCEKN